ncbi:DUF1599 domain-containing protein [Bacteroidota bacterium]
MENTSKQYDEIIMLCKAIFIAKMKDYGSAWRILRTSSLTDQIFIKAQRIKSIEQKGVQKIKDDIKSEYIGIINYSIMALIQLELGVGESPEMETEVAENLYDKYFINAKSLMENKNHDYSEAWRDMRVTSLTDIILMKLFRTKQIEDNDGKTFISEGVDANYNDIINYSVFALIMLNE